MNKKLLFIGAGIAQCDAIKKACDLGYQVFATDGAADAPGLQLAQDSRVIDVKDKENNFAWAQSLGINGVIGIASDIVLPTVLHISSKLGLPGLSKIPMEVSLDKSLQRQRFKNKGLAQPAFVIINNFDDLKLCESTIGFPGVMKPADNSGSRGVLVVEDKSGLPGAYNQAINNSKNGIVIYESFMDGLELTVEGISINGKHHILTISDKFKPEGPYRVATQLAYPAAITPEEWLQVENLLKAAYSAAEIDNSPTHSEIIINSKGPRIVEISCRGGGFFVFTRMVEAATGYDIVKAWICFCAGDPIPPVNVGKKGAVLRFLVAQPGLLKRIDGLEEARNLGDADIGLFMKVGDSIPELKTDGSRTGYIIARAADRNSAVALAGKIEHTIHFETIPE